MIVLTGDIRCPFITLELIIDFAILAILSNQMVVFTFLPRLCGFGSIQFKNLFNSIIQTGHWVEQVTHELGLKS